MYWLFFLLPRAYTTVAFLRGDLICFDFVLVFVCCTFFFSHSLQGGRYVAIGHFSCFATVFFLLVHVVFAVNTAFIERIDLGGGELPGCLTTRLIRRRARLGPKQYTFAFLYIRLRVESTL